MAELCRQAEATGADSLWAVDHLYWPHPIAEAFTTLAVAAVTTTRPLLGTCVLQLPLRPSSVVAKQATAIQHLSAGRFVLGLGVGIHEREYVRAGVDYRRRGRLMDEGVAGLRRAWAGPDEGGADYVQEPASAPVPLWFGGASPAARRRAAAVGDGWVPLFLAPDEYGTALAALRRETAEAGRDPEAVQAGVVVFACVGDDDQAPVRGAQWLSELYRLPAQGIPPPPGGRLARDLRRRAAAATPTPAPATFWSWWRAHRPSSISGSCGLPSSERSTRPLQERPA